MAKWRDGEGVEHEDERRPGGGLKRIKAGRAALAWPKRLLAVLHWYAVMARAISSGRPRAWRPPMLGS